MLSYDSTNNAVRQLFSDVDPNPNMYTDVVRLLAHVVRALALWRRISANQVTCLVHASHPWRNNERDLIRGTLTADINSIATSVVSAELAPYTFTRSFL